MGHKRRPKPPQPKPAAGAQHLGEAAWAQLVRAIRALSPTPPPAA